MSLLDRSGRAKKRGGQSIVSSRQTRARTEPLGDIMPAGARGTPSVANLLNQEVIDPLADSGTAGAQTQRPTPPSSPAAGQMETGAQNTTVPPTQPTQQTQVQHQQQLRRQVIAAAMAGQPLQTPGTGAPLINNPNVQSVATHVIQSMPTKRIEQIKNVHAIKTEAANTRSAVKALMVSNPNVSIKNSALVDDALHCTMADILAKSAKIDTLQEGIVLQPDNWTQWPTITFLDELCLLASNTDSLRSTTFHSDSQPLTAAITNDAISLKMAAPNPSQIWEFKVRLQTILQTWTGDSSLQLGNSETQLSIEPYQEEIINLLTKNCIHTNKEQYPLSHLLQKEMDQMKRKGELKTVDQFLTALQKAHTTIWDACNILKPVYSGFRWDKICQAMGAPPIPTPTVPTKDKVDNTNPANPKAQKGKGNPDNSKGKSGGEKGNNKSKSNLCTICGGQHEGDCLFKSHPNANHEKVPFRESAQGKAYLAAFASKGFEKLKTEILGGGKWTMPKKSGNIIDNHTSDVRELCQECTQCTSCTKLSLNNIDIPFDNESKNYLLLSYIKVRNSDEPLLIKALLDTGSLQEDGNYINENLFNRFRYHNNIVIVNKKSKTCNEILKTCISTNVEIKILWYYHNNLTDKMEYTTLTCKVVKSPYDLIIGRASIMEHQLLLKCHRHFNIDVRLFRTLTNSGRGEEVDHHKVPVNFLNLIGDNSQCAFPSTVAELEGFRKEGSILKKSDLLSQDPSWEDNIEFINEELPHIDDTIKDETDLISFEFTGENEEFNAEALKIFKNFKDVISTSLRTEPARIEPMKLKVDDSKWKVNANRMPPRMISREKEAALNKQIEDYLAQHVVEPSVAPYWSQVLMTPKPQVESTAPLEKKFRFCVDERNLNRATESSGGHIPNIKFMIQRIGLKRPKYFCKIDLTTGFFQAPVSKDSREYLTFTTNRGNYQFLRVPMGCKNSPAYFQNQLANTVLPGLLYQICELYIDDVLVFGNTPAELLRNVTKVLERFRKHNIIANPKKIRCGMSEIEHTGYLLNENGFTFSREKLDMVEHFDRPVLVKDLKSFLGLANHFRSVVQNHSLLAGPLDKLCANYQAARYSKVKWTEEAIASYDELKARIVNCPSMYFLQDNLPIFLATDASKHLGYGAYLYQKDPETNQEFPVAFISKSWQGAQVNWSTPDQEAFAIYEAFKKLHYLIRDVPFTLLTDHANLTYVNFGGSDKIQRYKAEMLQYDFDIQHIKGKDNLVPDILSRLRRDPQVLHLLNLMEEDNGEMGDDLLSMQELPDPNNPNPSYAQVMNDIMKEDDQEVDWFLQSKSFPLKALRHLHNAHGELAGHGGVERTYATLMTKDPAYWNNKKHLVQRFVRRCYFCQKMAMVKHQIHSSPFTTSSHKLFEKVCMDYIGPLPPDREGNKYILVVVDSFSRYVNLYASQSNTANECALALLDFTSTFGNPTVLFSDRGTHFANNIISELTKLMNFSQQFTAPYSSEENGLCERVNKEVLRHLRGIIFDKAFKYDWGRADLPLVKRIINNVLHSRLGTTPNSLVLPSVDLNKNMMGLRRSASNVSRMPIPKHSKTLRHGNEEEVDQFDYTYFLEHMQNRQELILELVKQRIQQVDEDRIGNYPSERTEFPIGSYVLLRPKPDAKFSTADKLHTPLKGPFKVIGHDKNTYQIQNLTSNKVIPSVNIQRLQPFYVNEVEDNPKDIANRDSDSFIIERIISHSPPKPSRVSELCFRVKWLGYDNDEDNTTECWMVNPDLKINKVVLRYMISIPHLRKFVNRNINLDSDDEEG